MIARGLQGVEFLVCNTDAQHLRTTLTDNRVQMGPEITGGLGCGANPEVGCVSRQTMRWDCACSGSLTLGLLVVTQS